MTEEFSHSVLGKIVSATTGKSILVIGEAICDVYLWSQVERISPEAPVPVARVTSRDVRLGGAANVAHNIATLGGAPLLASVIGDDLAGTQMRELMKSHQLSAQSLLADSSRPTITKTRVVAMSQQLLRIDEEETSSIATQVEQELLDQIKGSINQVELVVVSDYEKGMMTPSLITGVKKIASEQGKKIIVDTKPKNSVLYADTFLVKCNKKEAEIITGLKFEIGYTNLQQVCARMQELLRARIIITLGSDGVALVDADGALVIPTRAKEVFDVSGAGDTFIAGLALSLCSGASLRQAVEIGNHAAGIVVGKLGTATCSQQELLDHFSK